MVIKFLIRANKPGNNSFLKKRYDDIHSKRVDQNNDEDI